MAEREDRRRLDGVVVADDADLGGKRAGKRGCCSENTVPFIAAVELDEHGRPQPVHFDLIADLKATSVVDRARQALEPTVQLVTDGLASLGAAAAVVATYGAIIVTPRRSRATWSPCTGSTPSSPTSRPRSAGPNTTLRKTTTLSVAQVNIPR
jgi:hypothetical protein